MHRSARHSGDTGLPSSALLTNARSCRITDGAWEEPFRERGAHTQHTTTHFCQMSIYFGHPALPHSNQTVSPRVADRGLSLFKAKPCEVPVAVVPSVVQPGFACYARNLPAFMEATMANRITPISNRGYPLSTVPYLLPWVVPDLIYDFTTPISDTTIAALKLHSTQVNGKSKKITFAMREPTLLSIRQLVADYPTINQTTPHLIGLVNLDAMKMIFVMQKVLSAFFLTHGYSAFRHSSDVTPVDTNMEVVSKKRKVSTTTYLACMSDLDAHVRDPIADESEEGLYGPDGLGTDIQLTVAKPSTVQNDKWGSMDRMPNTSGLYFPYVGDLAVAETVTVPAVFTNYFIRSLASDTRHMFKQVDKLKSAWGVISQTKLGDEISHLCKCVDIALQAQAMVYPVYSNGIYEGSVLCGAGYTISVNGLEYVPLSYAELQKVVRDGSMHSKALDEICSVVPELEERIRACGSVREMSQVVKGAEVDELSKNSIVKFAHYLCFDNKYWSTSVAHVKHMLDYLHDPEKVMPSDAPMYPKYLFTSDRVEEVLSAFGHQAPTFMVPNGAKCDIEKMKDAPNNFHVRTIAVERAVLDMKYVVKEKYVTNNVKTLSSRHRDQSINSSDKKEVWGMLKSLCASNDDTTNEATNREVAGKSGKTVADDLW